MTGSGDLVLAFQPGVRVERRGDHVVVIDEPTARNMLIPEDAFSVAQRWVLVGELSLPSGTAAALLEDGLIVGAGRRGALRRHRLRALVGMDSASLRVFDRLLDHRRLHIGSTSLSIVLSAVGRSLGGRWAMIAMLLGVSAGLLLAAIPAALALVPPVTAAVLAIVIGVHEAAHLIALRRIPTHARSGALYLDASRPRIVRPELAPREAAGVALAGPIAGAATATVSAVAGVWGWWWVAVAVLIALSQLASLLPMFDDGRQLAGFRTSRQQRVT